MFWREAWSTTRNGREWSSREERDFIKPELIPKATLIFWRDLCQSSSRLSAEEICKRFEKEAHRKQLAFLFYFCWSSDCWEISIRFLFYLNSAVGSGSERTVPISKPTVLQFEPSLWKARGSGASKDTSRRAHCETGIFGILGIFGFIVFFFPFLSLHLCICLSKFAISFHSRLWYPWVHEVLRLCKISRSPFHTRAFSHTHTHTDFIRFQLLIVVRERTCFCLS